MSLYRTRSLNNLPEKKIEEKRSTINNNEEDFNTKRLKLDLLNRFTESNIPLEYWNLKMEKDFTGDPNLLTFYSGYTADIAASYQEGRGYVLAGSHGLGKMIDLQTDLLTPNGFIKLIDLKEGDQLFDENGNTCIVTKLHPIDLKPESYKVTFDDGSVINACADHLWQTWDRSARVNFQQGKNINNKPTIKNTKEIFLTQRVENGRVANHSIECTKPINFTKKDLSIDPYILGCWLGDGDTNAGVLTTMDEEILSSFYDAGYQGFIIPDPRDNKAKRYKMDEIGDIRYKKSGKLTKQLKQINLLNNKHIPDEYLFSIYQDRLAILQGLLDTDGTINDAGGIEFCTTLPELAKQVLFIVNSLGIKSKINQNESWLNGKRCKDRYRITFSTSIPVFRLTRKLSKIKIDKSQKTRTSHRFITKVEKINPVPMRCITVDSPSHLFLAGQSLIATHNTMTICCILKSCTTKGYTTLYSTLSDIVNVLTLGPNEDKFYARRELISVDFLAIDEWDNRFMANDNVSDLYARVLESIIRTRAQNKMPTLFATNSPNIIEAFSGSLKSSLSSLKNGYIVQVPVFGEDFRGKK